MPFEFFKRQTSSTRQVQNSCSRQVKATLLSKVVQEIFQVESDEIWVIWLLPLPIDVRHVSGGSIGGKWQERGPEGDARVMQGVGYLHLFNSFNDLLHQYICDQFLQNIVSTIVLQCFAYETAQAIS